MLSGQDLYEILEKRRIALGISQSEVGRRAFEQSDGSALQNMRRGASPRFDNLQKLCQVLGLDITLEPSSRALPGLSEPDSGFSTEETGAPTGHLILPWLWPVAGGGSAPLAFQAAWLGHLGLPVDKLAVSIPERSLLRSYRAKRCVVVIERGQPRRGAAAWVFRREGIEVLAKIAFATSTRLMIMPDDDNTVPELIEDAPAAGIELGGRAAMIMSVSDR